MSEHGVSDRKKAFILAVQISVFSVAFFVGLTDLAGRVFSRPASASGLQAVSPVVVSLESNKPVTPERLSIPSLDIDAHIAAVGVNWLGNMAVPASFSDVGWYENGPRPGEAGNAILAGHLSNSLGLKGVFGNLRQIHVGERIFVYGKDGKRITYAVTHTERYPLADTPQDLFIEKGDSQLILITCEGEYVPEKKTYTERLVVYAKPLR